MRKILLINVTQYTGPGALDALLEAGHTVVCHDPSFHRREARTAFEKEYPRTRALEAQSVEHLHREVMAQGECPDAIVLNNVHPLSRAEIEAIAIEDVVPGMVVAAFSGYSPELIPRRVTRLFSNVTDIWGSSHWPLIDW